MHGDSDTRCTHSPSSFCDAGSAGLCTAGVSIDMSVVVVASRGT